MKTLGIFLMLLLVLSIVTCRSLKKPPRKGKDLKLRRLIDLLKNYVDKRGQGSSSEVDEKDKERQTVHKDGGDVKPKDIKIDKDQANADTKDIHPTLPPGPPVDKRGRSGIETRNFGISTSVLWEGGIIPYEIEQASFGDRYGLAVELIQATAANISATTCVKWRPATNDDTYFVKFIGNEQGCWSYVGRRTYYTRANGGQPLNLGTYCLSAYIVLHEMHHAMGGIHEQQRDRRKQFVKINWENIKAEYNDQYALNQHTMNREPYDYSSILQYHLKAFSKNKEDTMTIRDENLKYLITNSKYVLSYYDLAEVNNVYDCPTAACTLQCQNEGFRIRAVAQTSCSCHCPTGLQGATCAELDTDADCGSIINLSNGGSSIIEMTSYTVGKKCTWLVKAEANSIIKATVTSIDLPFDSNNDCHHWLEFRDYLIGDDGKELCGQSSNPKVYTQTNIGEYSPFMIRFNARKNFSPLGTGFNITVEALQSGCMSSPCKTGSLCSENGGGGAYTCTCSNGMSGTNCDEFRAPAYNFCDTEDDYGTCLFDQDNSGTIIWSFNTRLCGFGGCNQGILTRGTGYQYLTMTPYYDSVDWNYGSVARISTTANFTAVTRCLTFEFAIGTYVAGSYQTELNVYVNGAGIEETRVKHIAYKTDYNWVTESVSIQAVENLVITIEGIMGPQVIGVDNISLRPGLCSNTPCNPNPCLNGGTCDESNPPEGTKYVCSCTTGYSGDRCEDSQSTNACDQNTCQNGATCVVDATQADGYSCDCDAGFTGDKCQVVNYCANSPCLNGGSCTSGATTFTCQCATGYTGTTCDAVNYCANSPCLNGGSCTSGATTFTCQCATGFTGTTCDEIVTTNACDQHACLNGASCVADTSGQDGYRCNCASGYTGDRCELVNYCANSPCLNGGSCTSGATTFTCQCATGYTGTTCDVVDYCANSPCLNGGSCTSGATTFTCQCATGFTGTTCNVVNYCANSPCLNGGSCTSGATTFTCQCATGYTGTTCDEIDTTNPCDQHACLNGASCVADTSNQDGYRCNCASGYTGNRCELVDYCANSPCLNGGSCTSGATTFTCQCATGYTGTTCDVVDYCANSPCLNGGSCTSGATTFTCQCATGYTGTTCNVVDYCANSPCLNGGSCTSGATTFTCQCATGYTGTTCNVVDYCANSPCLNGGSCTSGATTFTCQCATGYTGTTCNVVNYCANSPCLNGGSCTSGATTFTCQCATGFTGTTCDEIDTTNPCDQHACLNGASCVADTSSQDGYRCNCAYGYTGNRCELVDYCANSPCLNGGSCTSGATTFTCQCATGYTGTTCNVVDYCANSPCLNGGSCTSGATTFTCQCATGYTGTTCNDIETGNPCDNNPCQNGGSCVATPNGDDPYRCDCPTGYPGQRCEGRSCSFEIANDPACFLDTTDTTSYWFRKTGSTSSINTGPQQAHEGNYYFYFEATGRTSGSLYYFFDNGVLFENKMHCLSFHYHMRGSGMGELIIYTYLSGSAVERFSVSGDQGDQWHYQEVNLPLDASTYIVIAAERGSTFESDIAIDDVQLMPNACSQ